MGRIDLEKFPMSESALRMLEYVSTGFYEKSYVGKWLFQVMGMEYDDAFRLAETLPEQFFVETATWGLRYHEEKWQLPVRENLSYEERRRLIYRKRDYRAPMTPYRMELALRNATGLQAHVSDCHDPGEDGFCPKHPNIFRVDFTGEEIPDLDLARRMLDEMKQSHTTYVMHAYTLRYVRETIYAGAVVTGYIKNQPVREGGAIYRQHANRLYAGVSLYSVHKNQPVREGITVGAQTGCTGHTAGIVHSLYRQEIRLHKEVLECHSHLERQS